MTPEEFQKNTGASAEAMQRLKTYEATLKEWNPRINLVANSTIGDVWSRHFLDSAQLMPFIPAGSNIIDIGSGAGFPGLVLAAMGLNDIALCERDVRKAAFLRTTAVAMGVKVDILNLPAEAIDDRQFDIITSRALADVGMLLKLSQKLRKPSTICLFLKGKNLDAELATAQKEWMMETRRIKSATDPEASILRATSVKSKKEQ